MKAFLWDGLEEVSDNYHPHGSVLIEAESLERAREIAVFNKGGNIIKMNGIEAEPDAIFDSTSLVEKVWVFPNAGCC